MNKPITLCDRCKEYARCCLNYDGDNCRRSRTVEPTNSDRIRAMTDEELAKWIFINQAFIFKEMCDSIGYVDYDEKKLDEANTKNWNNILTWLKQEAKNDKLEIM